MELSLQHEHPNNPAANRSLKSEQSKSTKNITTIKPTHTFQPPQSVFFVPTVILPVMSTYNFYTDGLEEIMKQSADQLGPNVVQAIKERKRFSEQRIYQAIVNTSYDFVGVHLKEMKQGLKFEMHNLFETIHNSVEAGIWDGQYEIDKRNNYFSANRREEQLVSYITQELVKRNIDNFRQELDSVEGSELFNASGLPPKEMLKKRQAQDFVRRIQSEQARHKEHIQKLREERRSLQIRSMQQKKERQEQKRREHQSAIRQRIEKYNEFKTIESEHKKKMHSQYIRFIASAKKPLFKEMEEKFDKKVAEEQKEKFKIMRKLMKQRKPISFEDISQHMERYEELLYQNEQFRQQKRELKESQMEIIASQRPYRSKFYSMVVDSTKRSNQADDKTVMLQRQMDFADYVRRHFVPKIDQAKQEQIDGLIKRIANQKKHNVYSRKYMQEGKKNLQKLHLLIGELRAKNKIKEVQPVAESAEVPKRYVNYLEEVKKSRIQKTGTEISIDYNKKLESQDHQALKMQAIIRQNKAKQKDHYLNSALQTMDFDTHMKGRSSVEEDYLEAARAKMAILRKYKGEGQSGSLKDFTQQ